MEFRSSAKATMFDGLIVGMLLARPELASRINPNGCSGTVAGVIAEAAGAFKTCGELRKFLSDFTDVQLSGGPPGADVVQHSEKAAFARQAQRSVMQAYDDMKSGVDATAVIARLVECLPREQANVQQASNQQPKGTQGAADAQTRHATEGAAPGRRRDEQKRAGVRRPPDSAAASG